MSKTDLEYFPVPTVIGENINLGENIKEYIKKLPSKGYKVVDWWEESRYRAYVVVENEVVEEEITKEDQLIVIITTKAGKIVKVTYGNSIGTKLTERLKNYLSLKGETYSHFILNHKKDLESLLEDELGLSEGSLMYVHNERFTLGRSIHLEGYVVSTEPLGKRYLIIKVLVNSFYNNCLADYELVTEKRALKYLEAGNKSV